MINETDKKEAIRAAVREGRIYAAPEPDLTGIDPAFILEFFWVMLDRDYREVFATSESSVLDFEPLLSRQEVVDKLRKLYNVDCDDIKPLNLWKVIRRCSHVGGSNNER